MKRKTLVLVTAVGILVAGLVIGLSIDQSADPGGIAEDSGSGFALSVPAFAQGVPANQFPGSEAGISAYIKVEQTVDLAKATDCFRGIQAEGTDYIIGIVELAGLPEELWPHLYVNTDGWFLAYYSKYDPASKLMPWNGYEGGPVTTTTLRDALAQFTTELFAAMQVAYSYSSIDASLSYYDFRYPEAKAFVLAADSVANTADSLRYAIPSAAMVYEGSWAHYAEEVSWNQCWTESKVNGSQLYRAGGGTYHACGLLEEEDLRKEQAHTASIQMYGGGHSGVAVAFIYH